jgi:hypothetical protein
MNRRYRNTMARKVFQIQEGVVSGAGSTWGKKVRLMK